MAVDLLYVAYNRLEYTRQTLHALIENTEWDEVETLYVHDDGSTDGTAEYLDEYLERWWSRRGSRGPEGIVFHGDWLGGPVAAMNWYLDQHAAAAAAGSTVEAFAKVDNDMVVCPGWLGEMLRTMTLNPGVDVLGMEPMVGGAKLPAPGDQRTVSDASHIGGKGVIRHRAFRMCRMVPNGYFGFTEWQTAHEEVRKAWVTPDLPVFGLDQLPFEPWTSLAASYVEKGWHRHWAPYHELATDYWGWWTPLPLEAARVSAA